jgi:hypothetical protein
MISAFGWAALALLSRWTALPLRGSAGGMDGGAPGQA